MYFQEKNSSSNYLSWNIYDKEILMIKKYAIF